MTTTAEPCTLGGLVSPPVTGATGAPTESQGAAEDDAGRALAPAVVDFELIYETHFDFVWRSLRLLGVAPEAVEDTTQDVFSIASRQLPRFERRSSLRTWLFGILQRVAANQRRTQRRKLRRLQPLTEDTVSLGPTPQSSAEAAEAIDIVQSFCAELDLEWRGVFVLALLEELPAVEVSHALGIPVNTVYSRVRSMRAGLRRMLDRREE